MYKYNWKGPGEKKIEYTTRKTEMVNNVRFLEVRVGFSLNGRWGSSVTRTGGKDPQDRCRNTQEVKSVPM